MNDIRQCMKQLLATEWEGKPVWERIRDEEFTSAPAFKGNLYDTMPIKIMYVGHAVNGWEFDVSKCVSLEETLENVLDQENGLDTLVKKDTYTYQKKDGKIGIYNHINSRFFRLIEQVLEYQNESDSPTTYETWYNDTKKWNQKIIWSNLYNIAPRTGGNPENDFIKNGMIQYTEMIKIQIETYKPDIVIFCPLSGYFTPWKRIRSFDEILDSYESCDINNTIIGRGKLSKSQIIVCKRPDRWGKSHDDVREMAKVISDYIDCVCKK